MIIRVKTFATLYNITGKVSHEIRLEKDSTVREVIDKLIQIYPKLKDEILDDNGLLKENYRVLVNGREISHLSGLDTEVKDGDTIAIFPPVAGG